MLSCSSSEHYPSDPTLRVVIRLLCNERDIEALTGQEEYKISILATQLVHIMTSRSRMEPIILSVVYAFKRDVVDQCC